jgi:hypothetical protein
MQIRQCINTGSFLRLNTTASPPPYSAMRWMAILMDGCTVGGEITPSIKLSCLSLSPIRREIFTYLITQKRIRRILECITGQARWRLQRFTVINLSTLSPPHTLKQFWLFKTSHKNSQMPFKVQDCGVRKRDKSMQSSLDASVSSN